MATSVASVTSHFPKPQDGFTTTTSGSVSSGAATVGLNSTGSYANGDIVCFIIDPGDSNKKQAFVGTIDTSGVQVTNVVWTSGSNQSHASGATVVDYVAATHLQMMTKGILVQHKQDGTHADTITTDTINENTTGNGVTVDGVSHKDGKINTNAAVESKALAPTAIMETCTANVTTSGTTAADITGCTATFTPAVASVVRVTGVFDSDPDTANDLFTFLLDVDGADEASTGVHQAGTSGNDRTTIVMEWLVTLTAAAHTLKLQVQRASGSGTNTVRATNTLMIIELMSNANATVS